MFQEICITKKFYWKLILILTTSCCASEKKAKDKHRSKRLPSVSYVSNEFKALVFAVYLSVDHC